MLDALALTEVDPDAFTATHQLIPSGRAYGGEVVAQAVAAATRTAAEDRPIHSFHGYFLRAGDVQVPTRWQVDRVRDGRNFSVRAVRGLQGGRLIFQGLASFHVRADGVVHQDQLPAGLPEPESLPSSAEVLAAAEQTRDSWYWAHDRSFDIRHCQPAIYTDIDSERSSDQVVWLKAYSTLGQDPAVHRAALAYLCDYTLLESVLRRHGAAWSTPGVMTASLDHAMWWHADGRVDEWLALVQESPVATGGLGLTRARIFSRAGMLLATVAQQGLVSLP